MASAQALQPQGLHSNNPAPHAKKSTTSQNRPFARALNFINYWMKVCGKQWSAYTILASIKNCQQALEKALETNDWNACPTTCSGVPGIPGSFLNLVIKLRICFSNPIAWAQKGSEYYQDRLLCSGSKFCERSFHQGTPVLIEAEVPEPHEMARKVDW